MHWLDRNGFLAVHELLADQACEELVMLRSAPTREATGVLHAVPTRPGETQTLDGHVVAPSWKFGSARVWDGRVREPRNLSLMRVAFSRVSW